MLRSKWLDYLANNERWVDFLHYYQASDNTALECQYYWAHYKTGDQQLALNEAKRLWAVGDLQPKECDPLMSALALSPVFTPDMIWQRFELALKKDNRSLAIYLQNLPDKPGQAFAEVWLRVHKEPSLIEGLLLLSGDDRHGRIFAHGVDRMAKSDLDLAITVWDKRKAHNCLK